MRLSNFQAGRSLQVCHNLLLQRNRWIGQSSANADIPCINPAGSLLLDAVRDLELAYAEAVRDMPHLKGCTLSFDAWSNIVRQQLMAIAVILRM